MASKRTSYPSIFNDVIGPVMRGPSSSHCAAALRIGCLARDLMDDQIEEVSIQFDAGGSLATTHESQGSDMGLFGGLLGWEATDPRLAEAPQAIQEAGIQVRIEILELGDEHPNTYRLKLRNDREEHSMVALSTGGGMIQVIEIDSLPLSIGGDSFVTLIYLDSGAGELATYLTEHFEGGEIRSLEGEGLQIVQVEAGRFLGEPLISELQRRYTIQSLKRLAPVLPVLSHKDMQVPFTTSQGLLAYNKERGLALWQLAARYESARGKISEALVLERMLEVVSIMQDSIQEALEGTQYPDRILGYQSGHFREAMESGRLLDGGSLNRIILYTSAMMEQKSAMGVIVAAPTAGACGGLPGALIGVASEMGLSLDEIAKAMLGAGIVGVFIAAHATFAAEVAGCQAECGAGSAMAAAGLVALAGGTPQQGLDAASMALQNILGLICDPVANRVEVPCLGRNVMASANALACANMALAGYDPVIPLDEVIEVMLQVGTSIPCELRCTGLGGLSLTPASKDLEKKLAR